MKVRTYERLLRIIEGDDPSRIRRVGALVIHGMGTPDFAPKWPRATKPYPDLKERRPAFHLRMAKAIADRIKVKHSPLDPLDIAWQPIDYHSVMGPSQHNYLQRIASNTRWDSLRSFTLSALGDAASYDYRDDDDGAVYKRIQMSIYNAVRSLASRIEQGAPIILFANSLGGAVVTDYIWDRQKMEEERKKTLSKGNEPKIDPLADAGIDFTTQLTGIVTFGCNIPIFAHSHKPIEAIDFPDKLPPKYRSVAQWRNINDKDDVLGFPLIDLGGHYLAMSKKTNDFEERVLVDMPINTDWIPWLGTPFSHMSYWTDDDFIRPSAEMVARILEIA